MIGLRSPEVARKTHKKQSSTDSLNSLRKRKFLSVVSSEANLVKPIPHHQRKISELRQAAMGEITNHEEHKEHQLKIKRVSAQLNNDKPAQRGVAERMVLFKRRLTNLLDLNDSNSKENDPTEDCGQASRGLETPINRLLYESNCRRD